VHVRFAPIAAERHRVSYICKRSVVVLVDLGSKVSDRPMTDVTKFLFTNLRDRKRVVFHLFALLIYKSKTVMFSANLLIFFDFFL
jgi:hypothetical protein